MNKHLQSSHTQWLWAEWTVKTPLHWLHFKNVEVLNFTDYSVAAKWPLKQEEQTKPH